MCVEPHVAAELQGPSQDGTRDPAFSKLLAKKHPSVLLPRAPLPGAPAEREPPQTQDPSNCVLISSCGQESSAV